jgi:RND family efflux transporter MFP subunit
VGTIHASESAVLSAQVMGRIVSVSVREGDSVSAGQTLVKLDDSLPQADVARVQANLAGSKHAVEIAESESGLAASTLARYQILRERKSVSPQEFDVVERRSQEAAAQLESAKAQFAAAEAGSSSARTAAGYSRVTAPFAGTVTARRVDPGTLASPGVPLVEIDKAGPLQLHVTVDESLLPSLRTGMPVPVEVSDSSQPVSGTVAAILPAADPSTHSFVVKIALPASKGLRSGMYGTASIPTASRQAILLPQAALIAHGSLNSVWVLDSNHLAWLRYVTIGTQQANMIEALSGVSAGETVILNPGDRELSGKRIEVQP